MEWDPVEDQVWQPCAPRHPLQKADLELQHAFMALCMALLYAVC